MIRDIGPVWQALVASLFTWGVTALGAAVVFILKPHSKKLLDGSLGFAAGVMTAASFWSLLAPAIDIAEHKVGSRWAFLPVAIGFALGAVFVFAADRLMPACGLDDAVVAHLIHESVQDDDQDQCPTSEIELMERRQSMEEEDDCSDVEGCAADASNAVVSTNTSTTTKTLRRRRPQAASSLFRETTSDAMGVAAGDSTGAAVVIGDEQLIGRKSPLPADQQHEMAVSWRRIFLLIVAVTVHNIPEGLAVGVGFGSAGKTQKATFETAFNLALGIGLQNFPEGLAVSLPLAGFGYSKTRAFFYGQLSGMVEPIAAVLGALAVIVMDPILPYALSFAAGAMIFVVVDDIIPEAQRNGNGKLASLGAVVGFIIMMSLDVGLG